MKDELELKLQKDFPFMKQDKDAERNTYKKYGCECSGGWYQLIHDLCQEIADRYEVEGVAPDIQILQVKEKFGSLRFYHTFEGVEFSPVFDFLNAGISLSFPPDDSEAEVARKKLHNAIREIVHKYCEKSKTTCEYCGKEAVLRTDLGYRVITLCDECHARYKERLVRTHDF